MRNYYQAAAVRYRRSPYAIIAGRWKQHAIHALAVIGFAACVYAYVWMVR